MSTVSWALFMDHLLSPLFSLSPRFTSKSTTITFSQIETRTRQFQHRFIIYLLFNRKPATCVLAPLFKIDPHLEFMPQLYNSCARIIIQMQADIWQTSSSRKKTTLYTTNMIYILPRRQALSIVLPHGKKKNRTVKCLSNRSKLGGLLLWFRIFRYHSQLLATNLRNTVFECLPSNGK